MLAPELVTKTKAAIANITSPDISSATVDINNCDREPIHTPNAIQPHGVLLALNANDWTIIQVSQNTDSYFYQSPEALLGQPVTTLLSNEHIQLIKRCLSGDFEAINPLRMTLPIQQQLKHFNVVVHRNGDAICLEFEATAASSEHQHSINFFDFHKLVKRPINRFQQTSNLDELCQTAVEEIQNITGFDRVMVYRFDQDGSGSVIAEAKQSHMTPYIGLHYPDTDIPKQAKHLYLLNLLRIIPDIRYEPVPMLTQKKEIEAETDNIPPLDMSLSVLRSVSPLHTEYLSNMGVRASMSISLVTDNKLWGLIACHHDSPRKLSYEYRTVCEFLAQAIALELTNKSNHENADYQLQIKQRQTEFINALTQSENLEQGLTQNTERLLGLTGSTGAAFCEKGEITLLGKTPSLAETNSLIQWLSDQFVESALFQTATLSQAYAPAAQFIERTSGLLAISISQVQELYVLWFRPEVLQTVDWAGNPEKPIEIDEHGEEKMSPRRSFEKWQQTLEHHAQPWLPCEIEAALELRSSVIGLVLQRADELAELNSELARSNIELDSFAYIASHDLKEPLRGIHNYSSFLIEDYGDALGEDGAQKLHTLMRLTQRMENLISSLLHYSRLGRSELMLSPIDLNELAESVIELMQMSKPEEATIEITKPLPVVEADHTQITELLTNLITNAIKYNDKAEKRVTVGFLTGQEAQQQNIYPEQPILTSSESFPDASIPVLYVKDNGIGIREKHLEAIFRIFKRLHGPTKFGGGTGAGLTITKKIVEKHGGNIWVESTYGEGTTFYFTLAGADTSDSRQSSADTPPSQ
ncbi:MAG: ATP-binding protein [Cyanobacteria bacterium J06627_28]